MAVRLAAGQIWEETDERKTVRRRFVIVGFGGWQGKDVSCVQFFGMSRGSLAGNPKSGRKPRRFALRSNEFHGTSLKFTGEVVTVPDELPDYSPTKWYGVK